MSWGSMLYYLIIVAAVLSVYFELKLPLALCACIIRYERMHCIGSARHYCQKESTANVKNIFGK